MPGLDFLDLLAAPLAAFLPAPASVLAYGPGLPADLIYYFFAVAAWAGAAFLAILVAPFSALLRRLRRPRGTPPAQMESTPMTPQSVPEPAGEDRHDSA